MTTKIIAVSGGFYFFGTEVKAPDGYVSLKSAAMFGGFGGGKGLPGVSRGDKSATVTLDRFDADEELFFPLTAVFAVMPSIDLYAFKGTTIR
ncbi:hypothetical protein FHW69_001638 [Luteibacter sp. Sphag1AF]|uniref:hypothetical protein n=1 Tax=Luteibacter sp. Sphag1AF TaxID=2587031 RepID=UPI00161C286C|nr:hypothetical protein [Luteibacter sp. Sphag1AF]MBB3227037.1 hypothetical protein [Luteibacter sp. Sphag1AF]